MESSLARGCLARLLELPFVRDAQFLSAPFETGWDCILQVTTPEDTYELACEFVRSHLGREKAHMIVHGIAAAHPTIVMAPQVGSNLGDLFERERVNFVDAAGNCHLRFGDRYYARVEGKRPPERVRSLGMRAPAYRVLLVLLIQPELLGATARAIADVADVSPQTANEVRHRLIELGVLLKAGRRHGWAPGRKKDAVAMWLAGYASSLAPSLEIGRFRAKESNPDELEKRIEPVLDSLCDWRYGGGAAAMRLTGYYRGARTVLYLDKDEQSIARELRLIPDSRGPVSILKSPAAPAFDSPHPRCVHPLLVYADLLAEGNDRADDAAAEVHARHLAPLMEGT